MRNKFCEEVRKLHGVRFVNQGRSEHGADCAGVVVIAMKKCGLNPQTREDYSIAGEDYSEDLKKYMQLCCDEVANFYEVELGDILLLSDRYNGKEKYVGTITKISPDGNLLFTHTTLAMGKCVEELLSESHCRLVKSIWRIKSNG